MNFRDNDFIDTNHIQELKLNAYLYKKFPLNNRQAVPTKL